MKKNIMIAILLLTTLVCIVYSMIQKSEADTQRMHAEEQMIKAIAFRKLAEEQAEQARKHQESIELMLLECQKKNK